MNTVALRHYKASLKMSERQKEILNGYFSATVISRGNVEPCRLGSRSSTQWLSRLMSTGSFESGENGSVHHQREESGEIGLEPIR